MRSVGVGVLRQRASELLRLVEQGETIEITNHGRLVAVLAPPRRGRRKKLSPFEQLVADGEVILATRSFDELPEPLPVQPGHELPSARLARLRADER